MAKLVKGTTEFDIVFVLEVQTFPLYPYVNLGEPLAVAFSWLSLGSHVAAPKAPARAGVERASARVSFMVDEF